MESIAGVRPSLLIALLITVVATLILGIGPGQVLTRAKAGAATLSSPVGTPALTSTAVEP